MDIVKEDLKVRIANTMLEFIKLDNIKKKDIWFYKSDKFVNLMHNDDKICCVLDFCDDNAPAYPPYKPYFMYNENDWKALNGVLHKSLNDKDWKALNGVCVRKSVIDKENTQWIEACCRAPLVRPQCKITFQKNETDNNKITNVKIETEENENSKSTYTISLDDKGQVTKITKEGEELNKENYIEEINKPLFKDNINKHLTENIECELDDQQKVVFDTIKKHIGIKIEKDNKKEEESENGEVKEIKNNQATYSFCGVHNNCMGTPVDENSNITFHCFCCDI